MTTRHLLDLELVALLDTFPALHLTAESLPQTRNFFEEMMKSQTLVDPPAFSMISVREHHIPGAQGAPEVRVLVYLPTNVSAPRSALLWMHGGGYVLGTPDQDDR